MASADASEVSAETTVTGSGGHEHRDGERRLRRRRGDRRDDLDEVIVLGEIGGRAGRRIGGGLGDLGDVIGGERLQRHPPLPRQHDGLDESHHDRQATTEASTDSTIASTADTRPMYSPYDATTGLCTYST